MTSRTPTAVDQLANQYVVDCAALEPILATSIGWAGSDHLLPDYSPDGIAAQADLARRALTQLASIEVTDAVDEVTVAAMRERLGLTVESIEALDHTGDVNVIASALQSFRDVFDLMPTETAEQVDNIAQRLAALPQAAAQFAQAVRYRAEQGRTSARRQIEKCIAQAEEAAGEKSPFSRLATELAEKHPQAAAALQSGAAQARAAYADLAAVLREVAPNAPQADAVGPEVYERASRYFLGAKIDAREAHAWGIAELARIDAEQREVAAELYGPGTTPGEAMERLNNDPARQLHGTAALQAWMQETSDAAVAALAGTHFDIPEQLTKLDCKIAPSGSGGIYYTPPSDDFSRNGAMWWAVPEGEDTFTTWQEKTTVYHEGIPGHHLQLGTAVALRDTLNDWRRLLCWVSGHGEGWALYAERLMADLGFLSERGDYFGMLDGQRLRAARVVLDTGVHLGLPVDPALRAGGLLPADVDAERWDAEVAWRFLRHNVAMAEGFLRFELDRYLGWPGQAPSYKLGQRLWEEIRDANAAADPNFTLRDFHARALALGSVGLDVLRDALVPCK